MPRDLYAFLLSSLAGIATIIGFFFIYIKKDSSLIISRALGFSSGVMSTISIIDLMPNSLLLILKNNMPVILVFIGFLGGIIISSIIDLKSKKTSKEGSRLYKIGLLSMFVIMFHNIPEGIATFITTTKNTKLGLTLAIAIALHNIPEGIGVSIPIYYSTKSKLKSFIYTLVSGISEPIGAVIAYLFLARYINDTVLGILYSIIAGMMINISINELYKEGINYNKKNTVLYFLMGSILMIINHLLFG